MKLSLECVFAIIATYIKFSKQNLKVGILRSNYTLHKSCFQENVKKAIVIKTRKLIFFVLFFHVILQAEKNFHCATQKFSFLRDNRCTLMINLVSF